MKPTIRRSEARHIAAYYRAIDNNQITWGEPLTIREGKHTHVVMPVNDTDRRQ